MLFLTHQRILEAVITSARARWGLIRRLVRHRLLQGQLTAFIPEQHTDFIFAPPAKKPILGASRGCRFHAADGPSPPGGSSRAPDFSLVVIGIGTMIMFQVVVNIFMTIGLGPKRIPSPS